jgi:hypothetical protein
VAFLTVTVTLWDCNDLKTTVLGLAVIASSSSCACENVVRSPLAIFAAIDSPASAGTAVAAGTGAIAETFDPFPPPEHPASVRAQRLKATQKPAKRRCMKRSSAAILRLTRTRDHGRPYDLPVRIRSPDPKTRYEVERGGDCSRVLDGCHAEVSTRRR